MSDDTAFDWGTHDVPEDRARSLRFGPLQLHFIRQAGELRLAAHRDDEPGDLRWSRWAPGPDWDGRLALSPGFPDRPVVVKPEDEFWLMKGARARIFVRVPMVVRVAALGPAPRVFTEIPTQVLSDTWWGNPEEGDYCYFLDTNARRALADEHFLEHLCACPLELVNRSPDDLLVTRIALRTAYLSIYQDGTHLWSDVTTVLYRGEEEGSDLEVSGSPPQQAGAPVLLTAPERTLGRAFSARTFARIRSTLGGWI